MIPEKKVVGSLYHLSHGQREPTAFLRSLSLPERNALFQSKRRTN
jgi:hypothetical protein